MSGAGSLPVAMPVFAGARSLTILAALPRLRGAQTPLERPAQPEELAPAYVFLASEADSSYITGIVLPVLGGETIGG